MDEFIKNNYYILDIIKEKPTKQEIIDHNVIDKQYLAYYLYRILCKYENMIENSISSRQKINDIYTILRIPTNNLGKCYPMAHKMTYNEQLLDVVILGVLDILKEVDTNLKKSIGNKQYEEFIEFISEKTLEEILLNLKVLQQLFPNLGVTGVKPYIYDYYNKQNEISGQLEAPNPTAVANVNTSANANANANVNASMKNVIFNNVSASQPVNQEK